MRTLIVGPKSRLIGAAARCCPAKIQVGESVVQWQIEGRTYGERRFVAHVECLQATLAAAPAGRPVRSVRARYHALVARARARDAA